MAKDVELRPLQSPSLTFSESKMAAKHKGELFQHMPFQNKNLHCMKATICVTTAGTLLSYRKVNVKIKRHYALKIV